MSLDVGARFPFRETCNPDNPEEAFLWMLVALPGQNGAPLILPVEYLRLVSKRLWECGARPVADPVIKYRAPTGTEPHWASAPGTWVAADTPDPVPHPAKKAVSLLTAQQKAELLDALLAEQESQP
jgi:hypothetical protein